MPTPEPPAAPAPPRGGSPLLRPVVPPTPREVRRRKLMGALWVVGLAAVIPAVLLAVFVYDSATNTTSVLGSCMTLSGPYDNVVMDPVDCDTSTEMHFLVAKEGLTHEDCPRGEYAIIENVMVTGNSAASFCLMPVLDVDSCYARDDSIGGVGRTACGSPAAQFVVIAVHDVADAEQCANPRASMTFEEPGRTYCLGAA